MFTLVQHRHRTSRHRTDSEIVKDSVENMKNYEESYNEDKMRITNELKIIDKFVAKTCRGFINSIVEAERSGKKYCYLFKYNDDPDKGEIYNDTVEGLDTKYILSGEWIPLAKHYFPYRRCRSIETRLTEYFKDKAYNGGIDPVTNIPYRISVFYYKGPKSVFENGIICSRDGLRYN